MTISEFIEFLRQIFRVLVTFSIDGSIHFICMDWRHMLEVLTAAEGLYTELKNTIIWVKDNGGMGTFYRSRHEMIFAYKNGRHPTSTHLSLVSTVVIAPMCGNIAV